MSVLRPSCPPATVALLAEVNVLSYDQGYWAGLVVGTLLGAILVGGLAATIGYWGYRRFVLLERRTREAERLAELGQLTGGLAHEIKNPLSTIGLNLQLLDEELDEIPHVPQRSHKRLNTVHSEAIRLREILDDFLRYAGRVEVETAPHDLGQLIEDVADFFAPQAASQNVVLNVNRPDIALTAQIDEKQIKQAVLNLALNAVQHMPDGGRLELAARAIGKWYELRVTDTGPGIAAEDQPKIFGAYYSKRKGGTGLGLAMVRRIADAHNGEVALDSQVGRGSTFTIRLPV
ncbi:MAG: ATP-binding protein [Planctomycetota bacterium]